MDTKNSELGEGNIGDVITSNGGSRKLSLAIPEESNVVARKATNETAIDEKNSDTVLNELQQHSLKSIGEKATSQTERPNSLHPVLTEVSKSQELELRSKRLQQFQQVLSNSKFYSNFLNRRVDQLKDSTKIQQENERRRLKTQAVVTHRPNTRAAINNNYQSEKKESPIKMVIRKRGRPRKFNEMEEENDNDDEGSYAVSLSFEEEPQRIINGEEVPQEQPKWLTGGVMRDYQIKGLEWLKSNHYNGINGILADEMGLGKTIQCIALICYLTEENIFGPHLIIAPLSTLSNWVAEFARFSPNIPTLLYHGTSEERTDLLKNFKGIRKKGKLLHPVIVSNYDTVLTDAKILKSISWNYIIVDEGHRLKNPKCKLVQLLKSFSSKHRLLLTGTPLHNNLTELWSLLNFLLPDIFDKLDVFESLFDVDSMSSEGSDERIAADEQKSHIVSTLHEILSPFLLRRLKTDVELFLPKKKELLVYAPLTQKQQTFYKHSVARSILNILHPERIEVLPAKRRRKSVQPVSLLDSYFDEKIDEETLELKAEDFAEKNNTQNVSSELKKLATYNHVREQNIMMELRKCCNHPYLLSYPLDEDGFGLVNEDLVQASGKMQVIDALLPKLKERGHKVLLFSQMTRMLDIIQDYCDLRGYTYSILTGRNSLASREENIKNFSTDPENFLFLISTRAGGLGLNLVAADTVIVYDSDWNPQCDLQAIDRCHRIGQTKPVVIYRLVTANTIDQRIVDRAASKRKLEKLVMHKDKFKNGVKETKRFTKTEVLELLKVKDHEGVVQSISTENVFSECELNLLLDRSGMINSATAHNSTDELNFKHFKVIND